MAYDGIVTRAVTAELNRLLLQGKIEKVYQPEADELVFLVHTKNGNLKLFMSSGSSHARLHLVEEMPVNPPAPFAFCMLLRKHLQGARITAIEQKGCDRIIEVSMETLNELGFTVSKKLIVEIMGKHSNIILTDIATGKIIGAIKHVGFDVNRVRQILPGIIYEYPPTQDKVGFDDITPETPAGNIGGISPAFKRALEGKADIKAYVDRVLQSIESGSYDSVIYYDDAGNPQEFYITKLNEYEDVCKKESFENISLCLEKYYKLKESSNQGKMKSHDLIHSVKLSLDKMYLKKKRLSEDLLKAENSESLRLFGELLTANLYLVKPGMKSVEVTNYYDGSTVIIPLDVKASPQKNAQLYFKRYGKQKTAVKEKQIQLSENDQEIKYLESVLTYLENTDSVDEIERLRSELVETGFIRKRKQAGGYKEKKFKAEPVKYQLSNGMTCLVGRNNKENDQLTFKIAGKGDLWLHTKDIPGSHVVIQCSGEKVEEKTLFEAAGIAAFHSKGRTSENVPVDYVPIRYVKKPAGAKPGMVIFTNNKTIYVNPAIPEKK